jgi:ADP-heptose:LPS heptosyltransferase
MTAWLKKNYPSCTITFLTRNYTLPVVKMYQSVDRVVSWDDLQKLPRRARVEQFAKLNADAIVHVFPSKEIARCAKEAKVPLRIGTSHRLFHLFTCNIRINFTRKKSPLHEAQLNFELLKYFGLQSLPDLGELNVLTHQFHVPQIELPGELSKVLNKEVVILHPKSQGSAKEWPIEKYLELASQLAETGKQIVFTGTEKEGVMFRHLLPHHPLIFDSTGRLTLDQLCVLISKSNALVACSTGPLHIAGYCGIRAVGLFSPKKPIHPGRWKPLGNNSISLVFDESCASCSRGEDCFCLEQISVQNVIDAIEAPLIS